MRVVPTSTFVDALARVPLLTVAQRDELVRDLQVRFPDVRALTGELVRRGWLTVYQAHQVIAGRAADLVLGPYLLLDRLGEGGAGQVFKALHRTMNRLAALKMIRQDQLADAETVQRFRREIQLVSQLSHPNIVHAFDAGPLGANYVLVMEYVEGLDLARLIKQQGPLPVAQATDYVGQAALGLQHIYEKGLVHRDIKPSNLLVMGCTGSLSMPPWGLVKILDLGLARLQRTNDSRTMSGPLTSNGATVMGTLDYLAPEQALDFRNADIRADLYSLGCTCYFLLTGRPPFTEGTAAQKLLCHQMKEPPALQRQRPDVPPHVAAVVQRMMAKRPKDRYALPAEVARVLLTSATRCGATDAIRAGTHSPSSRPTLDLAASSTWSSGSALAVGKAPTLSKGSANRSGWRRRLLLWGAGGTLLIAGLVGAIVTFALRETPSSHSKGGPLPQTASTPRGGLGIVLRDDLTGGKLDSWSLATAGAAATVTPGAAGVGLTGAPSETTSAGLHRSVFLMGDFDASADWTPLETTGSWRLGLGLTFASGAWTLLDTADNGGTWYLQSASGAIPQGNPAGTAGRKGITTTHKVARRGDTLVWTVVQNGSETVLHQQAFPGLGALIAINLSAWSHNVPLGAQVARFRLAPAATAIFLADPGFEVPTVSAGRAAFHYRPSGSAWTFTGGAGVSGNQGDFTQGNPPAPEGKQVAFLQGTGSLRQTLQLPAGRYILGFQAAQRANPPGRQTLRVLVDGQEVGRHTPPGTSYTDFTTQPFPVETTGVHTFALEGLNPLGGDHTAFIDQVHIRVAPDVSGKR